MYSRMSNGHVDDEVTNDNSFIDESRRRSLRKRKKVNYDISIQKIIGKHSVKNKVPNGVSQYFVFDPKKSKTRSRLNGNLTPREDYQLSCEIMRGKAYEMSCKIVDQLYEKIMFESNKAVFDEVIQLVRDYSLRFVEDIQINDNHCDDVRIDLMPVVLFRVKNGGLSISDRCRGFYKYMMRKKFTGIVPCLVQIRACTGVDDILWEVVKQCKFHDFLQPFGFKDDSHEITKENNLFYGQKKSSLYLAIQALQQWACTSVQVHSIIVIIEDSEYFSEGELSLQSILLALTHSLLPISCITSLQAGFEDSLVGTTSSNEVWNSISLSMLEVPCSEELFRRFAESIFFSDDANKFPIAFGGNFAMSWKFSFQEHCDGSLIETVDDLKVAFARHFTREVSVMSAILSREFMKQKVKGQIQFCLNNIGKYANNYVSQDGPSLFPTNSIAIKLWLQRYERKKRYFLAISVMIRSLNELLLDRFYDDFDVIDSLFSEDFDVVRNICKSIEQCPSTEMLINALKHSYKMISLQLQKFKAQDDSKSHLFSFKWRTDNNETVEPVHELLSTIDEYTCFLHALNFQSLEEAPILNLEKRRVMRGQIFRDLKNWLLRTAEICKTCFVNMEADDEVIQINGAKVLGLQEAKIRNEISKDLLNSEAMHETCRAFTTMQIQRNQVFDEWFEHFKIECQKLACQKNRKFEDMNEDPSLLHRFSLCIYELQLLGFIRSNTKRRSNCDVEKGAILWLQQK